MKQFFFLSSTLVTLRMVHHGPDQKPTNDERAPTPAFALPSKQSSKPNHKRSFSSNPKLRNIQLQPPNQIPTPPRTFSYRLASKLSPLPARHALFHSPFSHYYTNTRPRSNLFQTNHPSLACRTTSATTTMLPSPFLLPILLFLSVPPTPAAATAAASSSRCTTSIPIKSYQKCINLPTQGATLAWTYHPHNATLDLAFSGTFISPSGWVAWGLNPDSPAMTGTRALVAFSDPTSGGLLLLPFILDPGVKLQRSPLVSRPLDLPLLSSSAMLRNARSVRDGADVHIFATMRLSPNRTRINHVWNRGLYVQGYSPTIHPTTPSDLASRATIDVVSTATEMGPAVPNWFRSTHAVLNAVSWGFLLPVGVTVARYLRQCTSVRPTWFYGHAAVQIAGFMVGTAGFSMGIIMGRASPGVTYTLHRGLGVAAFVTGGLQAAALLFRPKTTNRFRKYWKSYHHFVGYGCVVLGVVNVFQGFEVMGLGGSYWKLGYCLALSTLIGVCVALEVNAWVVFCRRAEEEKVRREGRVEGHQVVKGSLSI